ncbi:hypothetical protein CR513_21586, partial [Mucuna pruriens]
MVLIFFLMMMLKRNKKSHKMRIWVMLLNHLQFNSGGLISRDNHLQEFILVQANDALDVELLELVKVHTNDNGADMMTKAVPRGKFEVCYKIARQAITST